MRLTHRSEGVAVANKQSIPGTLFEMELQNSSSEVVVATPEQCRILLSPVYRGLVKSLMAQPQTLSGLAKELDLSMDRVYYRVKHLEAINLVKVVRVEARRGKPLKYYGMTANRYEVPFSNTPSASLDEMILGQVLERQEVFRKYFMDLIMDKLRTLRVEPSFFIELRDGALVMDLEIPEEFEMNSTIVYWRPFYIRRSDATSFFKDVLALTERYTQEASSEEKTEHLLGIQLVRKP